MSAGRRAYCPGLGYLDIEAVEPVTWDDLTEADAIADGFATLGKMKRVLLSIYPNRDDGKQWWRVRFSWVKPAGWVETRELFET